MLLFVVCVSFSSSHKKTSKLSNIILHQFEGLHKLWDTPVVFDAQTIVRSSCDSIKTPMEFDCCSHAIFLLFLPHTGKSTLQIPQFNRFQ